MGGASNADEVRRYFDTWNDAGMEAFLALLPADVEWHPHAGRRRVLLGREEVRSFWAENAEGGETVDVEMSDLESLDEENVLVTGRISRRGQAGISVEQVAWLYSFRDGRLWRVSGHSSATEARQAARFMHTDRVAMVREGPHFALTLHEEPGGRSVLELTGELDLGVIDELRTAIDRAARSRNVLVDLSGLTFMDSSGLRILLEASRSARQDGWRLELRRGPEVVQRIITMTGADRLLPFEPA